MRKLISVILILSVLLLNSCALGGSRINLLNKSTDEKQANARLEQVIEAIKNRDKEAFKTIFSKAAQNKADDFNGSIDSLFRFFQGEVESWEKPSGPTVFDSNNYGHVTKKIDSSYYVNTDKQRYFFLLVDYPIDTDHPDNVGLSMLLAVRSEDEEKIWDEDQKIIYDGNYKLTHFGIYIPLP